MRAEWWCKTNNNVTFRWDRMYHIEFPSPFTDEMDLQEFIAHLASAEDEEIQDWKFDLDSITVIGDCEFMLSSDNGVIRFKKVENRQW